MARKTPTSETGKKAKASAKPKRSATPSKAAGKPAKGRSGGRSPAKAAPDSARRTTKAPSAAAKSKSAAPAKKTAARARPASRAPTATAKTRDGNGQVPEHALKIRKSRLKPEDLDEFRQMLITKRQELVGDVTHLESEAMRQSSGAGASSSSMPIHMADLGSDTWEQELTLGLIENERGLLREIDEALDRIENKTYGVCLATNKPITKSRLRAQPWAKYCIEYARKRELGLV